MAFTVTHIDGSMDEPDDVSTFPSLLDELAGATDEHPDVAVGHESGWTLTVLPGGVVVWENVEEDDDPRHLEGLSRDDILALMELVASGDVDAVADRPWVAGHGS